MAYINCLMSTVYNQKTNKGLKQITILNIGVLHFPIYEMTKHAFFERFLTLIYIFNSLKCW